MDRARQTLRPGTQCGLTGDAGQWNSRVRRTTLYNNTRVAYAWDVKAQSAPGLARRRQPLQGMGLAGRWLTACLAVAAILINCVLVQTHFEQSAYAAAEVVGVETAGSPISDSDGGSHALSCPVCKAASAAGGFALQPQTIVAAPRTLVMIAAEHADTSLAAVPWSHAWRSRAPPSLV